VDLQSFILKPFRMEETVPDIRITGTIARMQNTLSVGYTLEGNVADIAIPAPDRFSERKDRLWDHTCLELFLGTKGSERYWEVNLSPAGHWNVYSFASYRKGMREEAAFSSLPFQVRTETDALRITLDLVLGKILPGGQAIEAAVGAVVRTKAGAVSHWALAHPGLRPDFHRRDGFRVIVRAD
jgi:hypothetical protein